MNKKIGKMLRIFVVITFILTSVILPIGGEKTAMAARLGFNENDTIYQIMVDRFLDGDATNNATGSAFRYAEDIEDDFRYMHGGDWQGVINKLQYIKNMGYTAIWISPVAEPQLWSRADSQGKVWPTAYHGYNVKDPNVANHYFGTKEKLKQLVDTAHTMGIRVIIDIVPNHIGDYMYGTQAYYDIADLQPAAPFNNPSWYHHNGDINWSAEHPHTASSTQMLEDHDLGGLDDIDHDNASAKTAINNSIKTWFDYLQADGARVDAAKCMRPSYINELQTLLGVNSFGENFDMHVSFVKDWVGSNAEWGMLDFPLFQSIVHNFAYGQAFDNTAYEALSLKNTLAQDYLYNGNENHMVTFIDNHDRNRFLTEAGGNVQKLQNALTFIFTARGVPAVFQGTEQNKGNGHGQIIAGIGDTWNRWCMVKKNSSGGVIENYFREDADTFALIAKLNKIRQSYEALRTGKQREMWASANLYAFSRRVESGTNVGQEVVSIFSNSGSSQTQTIPLRSESTIAIGTTLTNLLDPTDTVVVTSGGVTGKQIAVTVGAQSSKVYAIDTHSSVAYKITYTNTTATTVSLHYGVNGWKNVKDVPMTKSGTTFTATVVVNKNDIINYCTHITAPTDYWDSNSSRNWSVFAGSGNATLTKIPVTFTVNNATTVVGQNVYICGDIAELGNWASAYAAGPGSCPSYPTWTVTVNVPAGQTINFKAIKRDGSGNTTWEGGSNRQYVVPASGSGSVTFTWTN